MSPRENYEDMEIPEGNWPILEVEQFKTVQKKKPQFEMNLDGPANFDYLL